MEKDVMINLDNKILQNAKKILPMTFCQGDISLK